MSLWVPETGADWSRLAVAAGATLSAVFALYAVLWIGAALSAGELIEPSPVFELAWQLHAAAFAFALPALGMAEQQIQPYEASDYRSAKPCSSVRVADALGVTVAQHAELDPSAA